MTVRYVWRGTCNINSVGLNFFFVCEFKDRVGQFHFSIQQGNDLQYFFEVFLCWFAGFVVSDLHLNVGYNDNIFLL